MLIGTDFQPVAPSAITRRLSEINPRLGLKVVRQPGADEAEYWWAFTLAWASTDPRWQMIQRGDMGANEAYDIIGQLPRDAGVDEAYGYFVQSAKAIQTPADKEAILARAAQWAEEPFEQAKAEQVALVAEDADQLLSARSGSRMRKAGRR